MSERGQEPNKAILRIRAALDEIVRLPGFFGELAQEARWPDRLAAEFQLCCEELVTNTISYGYPGGVHGQHIEIEVRCDPGSVEIAISDGAIPFNPLAKEDPDLTLGIEERPIGGLGIYFVKRLMDEVRYEPQNPGNRIIMRKTLGNRQEEKP